MQEGFPWLLLLVIIVFLVVAYLLVREYAAATSAFAFELAAAYSRPSSRVESGELHGCVAS